MVGGGRAEWPRHHQEAMVKGQAEVLHVRVMEEIPIHLDDVVLELTEATRTG